MEECGGESVVCLAVLGVILHFACWQRGGGREQEDFQIVVIKINEPATDRLDSTDSSFLTPKDSLFLLSNYRAVNLLYSYRCPLSAV
jgi:hypothetical protein